MTSQFQSLSCLFLGGGWGGRVCLSAFPSIPPFPFFLFSLSFSLSLSRGLSSEPSFFWGGGFPFCGDSNTSFANANATVCEMTQMGNGNEACDIFCLGGFWSAVVVYSLSVLRVSLSLPFSSYTCICTYVYILLT